MFLGFTNEPRIYGGSADIRISVFGNLGFVCFADRQPVGVRQRLCGYSLYDADRGTLDRWLVRFVALVGQRLWLFIGEDHLQGYFPRQYVLLHVLGFRSVR